MTKTRIEINFVRLMNQCKAMANNNNYNDWRFEEYISTLDEYFQELRKSTMPPSKETLDEYSRTIAFLKGLLVAEKLPSASVKVVASQLLSPSSSSYDDPVTKEIQLKATAKYTNEMRNELMQPRETDPNMELRKRKAELLEVTGNPAVVKDADSLLKNEQEKQEALTADLLLLTRSLKEQTLAANAVVKQDIDTLGKSNQAAESNQTNLHTQTMKLREFRGFCTRCWIWLLLGLVCSAFISMVVFMKIFKKKAAY